MRSKLLAVCLFAAAAGSAWAQQSFVPTVIASAGAPSTLLFGQYGNSNSLLRSQDSGSTWTPVYITQAGLPQPPVGTLIIDPTNSNTVYLSTTLAAGILWKSTDGGNTWTQPTSGLPANLPVNYFDLVTDTTGTYLFLQLGTSIYMSPNGGTLWLYQGVAPTSSGSMIVAPSNRGIMYYIDAGTLKFYVSLNGGESWASDMTVPGGAGATVSSLSVPAFDANDVFVTVNIPIQGQEVFATLDGSPFTNQSGTGLGAFTSMASAVTGPMYAFTNPVNGFYRSLNSAQSWQNLGVDGLQRFGATTLDPNVRSTLYGLETQLPATQPEALVKSVDSGITWNAMPATILPTISQPVPMYNVTLEQGAPYAVPFGAQLLENTAWITPATVTTSGESWIKLGTGSGNTPFSDSFSIDTTGLTPGTYLSTITIAAPQTSNKSVSIPVHLTLKPAGALGPGYLVSTVAGNGNAASGATTGAAPANLAVGDVRAVAIDASGNIDFSAGNRLWQFTPPVSAKASGVLTALAGNGINASVCQGGDPLSGSLADPDSIAFDAQGAVYLPEYAAQAVCKYTAGNLYTALNLAPLQASIGIHTVVLDPLLYMLLPVPSGILRWDGAKLTVAIPAQFSNPYSMLEDSNGNFYVSDTGLNQVFKITRDGTVTSYAGTGTAGFGGDGGPANQALLSAPAGIAFDSNNTLYIADSGNSRIRTVTSDGYIHTIAGTGVPGFAGDGMTADFASFQDPLGVAADSFGNIWIADAGNFRLRELTPQNTPTPQPRASNPMQGPNVATTLSPGSIFSLYGALLAPAGPGIEAMSNTWPRSINDVSVTINGIAAPLYFVSPAQINGQIPFETAPGPATAIIAVNGSPYATVNFNVVVAQPDVLVQNGGTQAVAVNQNGSVNTPSTPAHGNDVEVVYLTGIGIPTTAIPTGAPSPSAQPLALANYPYSITVNGQQTTVKFLGYAPGFPALVQANFVIPQGLTGNLQLVVTVNGVSSVPTIITVQ